MVCIGKIRTSDDFYRCSVTFVCVKNLRAVISSIGSIVNFPNFVTNHSTGATRLRNDNSKLIVYNIIYYLSG